MKLRIALTLFLFAGYANISAHTINQSLEQAYIDSYMPLLFLAKLLPFIAWGMLAYNVHANGTTFQFFWKFIVVLGIGIFLGLFTHFGLYTSLLNGLGVLIAGILLIYLKSSANPIINYVILSFSLVLGISYGGNFLHAENLWWFYVLTFSTGSVLFIFLSKVRFIGNPRFRFLSNILSIIFILSGIVMVLLS